MCLHTLFVAQFFTLIFCFAGLGLVAVICTLLSSYLLNEDTYRNSSSHAKELFDLGLTSITSLGATYPAHFKTIISSANALKSRIEGGAKLNQSLKAKAQERAELANKQKEKQLKPTIQLKMNFGNFN